LRNHDQARQHLERRGNLPQAEIFRTRSYACIAHYYDPHIIKKALVFYTQVGQWILNLAETNPKACGVLPEYIFEDVIAIYGALSDVPPLKRECKDVYDENALISFCIKLLADNSPCKNVHHRGKLIRVILGTIPFDYQKAGSHLHGHVLNRIPESSDIVPRLLKLYADVEDGDYYVRHSYRYDLARILQFLWMFEVHQKAIHSMWSTTPDNFIRMINMLINDNIQVLDDALETLKTLHELEHADDAGSEENQKKIEEMKKKAKSGNQLSVANLKLLCWLTQNIQEPFFDSRILGRIATMTNVYLKKLTLEKANLLVSCAEEIKFEPKELLRCMQTIFLQLSRHNKEYLKAISEDEAYYSPDSYKKALMIFKKRLHDQPSILLEFKNYSDEIEVFQNEVMDLESRLGEIPEKYTDPMLCTLMRDPVRLPTNNMVMDRKEISIQLLNKSQCPFTKKPLTVDELIPVPELKAEIDAWIKERLAQKDVEEEVESMAVDDGTNV